jgi:hypothetical protein
MKPCSWRFTSRGNGEIFKAGDFFYERSEKGEGFYIK